MRKSVESEKYMVELAVMSDCVSSNWFVMNRMTNADLPTTASTFFWWEVVAMGGMNRCMYERTWAENCSVKIRIRRDDSLLFSCNFFA